MSIEDPLHNKYSLVKGAARRARQLQSGAAPLLPTKSMKACRVAQDEVDALYVREDEWSRKAAINCLNMGYFSSDRSIREYADRIWAVKPVM